MIKNFVKRYRFFLILLVINISLLFISPEIGKKSFSITYDNLLDVRSYTTYIYTFRSFRCMAKERDND